MYVEKHIKTQLTQLYQDIMDEVRPGKADRPDILEKALTLASIVPDEMAYRITKDILRNNWRSDPPSKMHPGGSQATLC